MARAGPARRGLPSVPIVAWGKKAVPSEDHLRYSTAAWAAWQKRTASRAVAKATMYVPCSSESGLLKPVSVGWLLPVGSSRGMLLLHREVVLCRHC